MMKFLSLSVFFFIFLIGVAHAATDNVTVRQLVGNDINAPTVPSALIAVPIAQTQINLSWGTSTDDFLFGGYQVFRDATQIATTTLTTYSDTGLTASTTYSYFVRAYDNFFNISSSSNVVATTTFPITPTSTPTTTPTDTGGGLNSKIELQSFNITPAQHSALVDWKTNRYAQFEFRWGRTSSYELGFVYSDLFMRENTTRITELQPGTVYQYQLIAHDHNGRTTILKEGEFTTLDAPDTQAPQNVSNLRAVVVDGDDVRLTWNNPSDSDFSFVRIVRNYLFYPTNIDDGYLLYQDKGTTYLDKNVLQEKKVQYYTVFSYDKDGNISSGAVVSAHIGTHAVVSSPATSSTLTFGIADVELVQDSVVVKPDDVAADFPLTFRIAYEKLPEHLKTITITLVHPQDAKSEFTFLLKINKEKTYYEATIDSLRNAGLYPMTVSVFDYDLQQLTTVYGQLVVTKYQESNDVFSIPLSIQKTGIPKDVVSLLWILLLLFLLYVLHQVSRGIPSDHVAIGSLSRTQLLSLLFLCLFVGGASAYGIVSYSLLGNQNSIKSATANVASSFVVTSSFVIVAFLSLLIICIALGLLYVLLNRKK